MIDIKAISIPQIVASASVSDITLAEAKKEASRRRHMLDKDYDNASTAKAMDAISNNYTHLDWLDHQLGEI